MTVVTQQLYNDIGAPGRMIKLEKSVFGRKKPSILPHIYIHPLPLPSFLLQITSDPGGRY